MKRPLLVGIVNVTPDSFSGDGRLAGAAVARAEALVNDGADLLDIGAESTRPGATLLDAAAEWTRLGPVLAAIADAPWRSRVKLSIDTRHASTAQAACLLGVDIVNDVSGLQAEDMLELVAGQGCACVVMHSLGLPADAAVTLAPDVDPIDALLRWKSVVTARAVSHGIAADRLIYDPGLGFGKTPEQCLALVLAAGTLTASGGHWLFGHSRKSFLRMFDHVPSGERDALTRAFSSMLAAAGVTYLRVHDMAGHRALFDRICM